MVRLTPLPFFQDHRRRAHTARNCADGAKASRMHLCRFITGSGKALSSAAVSHGSWHGMDVRWKNRQQVSVSIAQLGHMKARKSFALLLPTSTSRLSRLLTHYEDHACQEANQQQQ